MGKYRTTSLLAAKDLGPTGTEVIEINVQDVISRIDLHWQTKVVTVSVETASLVECISKVELIDGSDVLYSLSGKEICALNYYDRAKQGAYEASLTVADYTKAILSLDFGRYLWDTEFALDPKKFKNLQLKITWDEDAANGSVVENEAIVNAHVFDEKTVSPRGFFMAKEIFTYTPTGSASEFIDLPTDYMYRKMLIMANSTDKNPFEVLDQVKLSENNDKKIPLDLTGEEFYRAFADMWPRIEYKMTLDAVVTAKTIYAIPTYDVNIHINYDGTAFVTAQSLFAVPTVTNNKIALTASVDIQGNTATIGGYLPLSNMCYPFGIQEDPADWYNAPAIKSLQLILKSASAAGTSPSTAIVLQQVRTY